MMSESDENINENSNENETSSLEEPLLEAGSTVESGSSPVVTSRAQRMYKSALRFIQSRTGSKTDYLGMDADNERGTKDESEEALGVNRLLNRNLVESRSLSVLDEIDAYNGFAMSGHFSLRSSIHKTRNAVLLNEGNHQLIFEPRRRIRDKYVAKLSQENMVHGANGWIPVISKFEMLNAIDRPREDGERGSDSFQEDVPHIEVKKATRYGNGVVVLKVIYSYIAFVLCGFCFALALILMLQYTLGVFLAGVTATKPDGTGDAYERTAAVLTLLALPVIIQTLALLINLFTGFLRDGWNDYDFLSTIPFVPRLLKEWITTAGAILIPVLVCVCSLLSKALNPWENTLLAAFWCTLGFYTLYAILVFALQISSCFDLISLTGDSPKWWLLLRIIALRVVTMFSIVKTVSVNAEAPTLEETVPGCLRWAFSATKERVYDYETFGKVTPHATEDGYSLLYLCCLLNRRMKGRMPYTNLINAVLCMVISTLLLWLLCVGYFVYSDSFSTLVTVVLSIVVAGFIVLFCLYNTKGLRQAINETMKERESRRSHRSLAQLQGNPFVDGFEEQRTEALESRQSVLSEFALDFEEIAVNLKEEKYIVAKPSLGFALCCGFLFATFLCFIPLYGFRMLGVRGYEYIFISACAFVFIQFVFNVRSLIEILGPTAYKHLDQKYAETEEKGIRARRAYMLITQLFKPERGYFWLVSLTVAVIFALFLASLSLGINNLATGYKGFELIGNASHPTHTVNPLPSRERGFQYPACDYNPESMPQTIGLDFGLLDFAFLSDLAYADMDETQAQVDRWFGKSSVRFVPESNYPKSLPAKHSKAVYKLFSIKTSGAFAPPVFVLSVRGTINPLDLLTDAQIWLPALMMQLLRTLLPFGYIWNELLPRLIYYMNILETSPSSRSAYYTDVINLVNGLQQEQEKSLIVVTGHSLGGGVAIIAGARLRVPAIAFSGPNAMLSRLKFQLSVDNLNKYPLNVIPQRDPFPMTDDVGLITEHIRCRASVTEGSVACHEISRTACELQYTCGSRRRPPIKACNDTFGYPPATPLHAREIN